jgi:hypothetical protein
MLGRSSQNFHTADNDNPTGRTQPFVAQQPQAQFGPNTGRVAHRDGYRGQLQ